MTSGLAALALDAGPDPLQRPFVDLQPLVRALRDRGWTEERLRKNDLPCPGEPMPSRYVRFWRTIEALHDALHRLACPAIVLKSVRMYEYQDGNVDVLVPPGTMWRVAKGLSGGPWEMPGTAYLIEQQLMERHKLKLLSRREDLVDAHLYEGIGWRYQDDLGVLGADRSAVRLVESRAYLPDGEEASRSIAVPALDAELVLQAAHIVFENYRLTVGEAVNLCLLVDRHPDAWPRAEALAAGIGCRTALLEVVALARWALAHLEEARPERWPAPLPMTLVVAAHRERVAGQVRSGRIGGALGDLLGLAVLFPAVRAVRRARYLRRGREDYR